MQISEIEATRLGYDKAIFSFEDKEFILGCHTYQEFIRDEIDFVLVKKNNKFNLFRKSKDISLKLPGTI